VKRGFVDPWKIWSWSKLPCLGWRSANFLQRCPILQNIFRTSANILVLVPRFLCS
jgi:hypothetical protein